MSGSKTPTIIAITALAVAVLFATPIGQAAGNFVLAKNSVGMAQIKKNAVNSLKVKNGTLMAADFKAGQIPAGPQGPKGDPGAPGPKGDKGNPGVAGVTVRTSGFVTIPANSVKGGDAQCQAGELALGGGAAANSGLLTEDSYHLGAFAAPTGWHVNIVNTNAAPSQFYVEAVCAKVG